MTRDSEHMKMFKKQSSPSDPQITSKVSSKTAEPVFSRVSPCEAQDTSVKHVPLPENTANMTPFGKQCCGPNVIHVPYAHQTTCTSNFRSRLTESNGKGKCAAAASRHITQQSFITVL